jgi:serine/threonine protein phosphatase PrpC
VVSREPEFSVTLVNFEKYREKDHTAAARQRRRRAEKRHALRHDVTRDVTVHHGVTPDVTQAEAYTEAEEDLSQSVSAVHVDPHTSPTSDGLTDGLTDFSDKRPAQRVRWIQSRSELELADSLWHAICAEHNDIHPEDITAAIRRLGNWLSKNPDQLIRYAAELEPWLRKKVRQDCERIRHVTGRSPPPPPPSGGDQ